MIISPFRRGYLTPSVDSNRWEWWNQVEISPTPWEDKAPFPTEKIKRSVSLRDIYLKKHKHSNQQLKEEALKRQWKHYKKYKIDGFHPSEDDSCQVSKSQNICCNNVIWISGGWSRNKIKVKIVVVVYHASRLEVSRGVEVYLHSFLTLALWKRWVVRCHRENGVRCPSRGLSWLQSRSESFGKKQYKQQRNPNIQ
jgi:hypothetical protein